MMKRFVFSILAGAPLLLFCGSAMAISTVEDTLKLAPEIFRTPSTIPPNNTQHRSNPLPGLPPGSDIPWTPDVDARDEGARPDEPNMAVPIEAVPWTVAISESPNLGTDYLCAGVIVDPHWVLTAAHCTFGVARRWPNNTKPYVFVKTNVLASPGPSLPIEEIVTHPQYNARTLQNDLALVKIDAGSAGAGPTLDLDGPQISEQVGEIGNIYGWGISASSSTPQNDNRIQLLQIAVHDKGTCFNAANFSGLSNEAVFCGRSLHRYRDACARFGGSPLVMVDKKGRKYLAGLVSWSADCTADFRKLNVYLDVQRYVPWIKSVIGDNARPTQ